MPSEHLPAAIKKMMVESLMLKMTPEEIQDDMPLFTPDGLGLDSIDALELAVAVEKNFGAKIPNAEVAREAMVSVRTLADFIEKSGGEPSAS